MFEYAASSIYFMNQKGLEPSFTNKSANFS